jgi:hypothetical protein
MGDERGYYELLADGDEEATADFQRWPGVRRHDPVGDWPRDRLDELVRARPDLLPELITRRGEELTQL